MSRSLNNYNQRIVKYHEDDDVVIRTVPIGFDQSEKKKALLRQEAYENRIKKMEKIRRNRLPKWPPE